MEAPSALPSAMRFSSFSAACCSSSSCFRTSLCSEAARASLLTLAVSSSLMLASALACSLLECSIWILSSLTPGAGSAVSASAMCDVNICDTLRTCCSSWKSAMRLKCSLVESLLRAGRNAFEPSAASDGCSSSRPVVSLKASSKPSPI